MYYIVSPVIKYEYFNKQKHFYALSWRKTFHG